MLIDGVQVQFLQSFLPSYNDNNHENTKNNETINDDNNYPQPTNTPLLPSRVCHARRYGNANNQLTKHPLRMIEIDLYRYHYRHGMMRIIIYPPPNKKEKEEEQCRAIHTHYRRYHRYNPRYQNTSATYCVVLYIGGMGWGTYTTGWGRWVLMILASVLVWSFYGEVIKERLRDKLPRGGRGRWGWYSISEVCRLEGNWLG